MLKSDEISLGYVDAEVLGRAAQFICQRRPAVDDGDDACEVMTHRKICFSVAFERSDPASRQ